jgi:hypothetical protein
VCDPGSRHNTVRATGRRASIGPSNKSGPRFLLLAREEGGSGGNVLAPVLCTPCPGLTGARALIELVRGYEAGRWFIQSGK